MNKKIRRNIRIITSIFIILWLFLIYRFSMDTGIESHELSNYMVRLFSKVVEILTGKNLILSFSLEHYIMLELFFRKLAHMFIYFVLSISVMIFMFTFDIKMRYRMILTVLFCFLYACSDEWHQSFVAGRGPSLIDTFFDTSGAILGIICSLLLFCIAYTLFYKMYYFKHQLKTSYSR